MNGLRKLSLMAAMLVCTTLAAVAQKPNIHILATGGTIAGTGAVSYTHLHTADCIIRLYPCYASCV